ncbi:MAG: group II intron reverse transcriptase/maturase [Bryobacterales bacterium]|nr:group II intron reverse transcriptase/maturase [Bryobacterales bacterium]
MSLVTPIKVQALQRKLSEKAKREPNYRFYALYDKIRREDVLAHAYAVAKANQGAAGVDGETFAGIEAAGREAWLARLAQEVRTGTYRPQAVRRVLIPKAGGGERPLGIPTIRDRVVQTAVKLILEPIFEVDLEPNAYGYRPGRSARDAIQQVHRAMCLGRTDVVDADLSKYFDTIPHADLMKSVARRIADGRVLHLIKMWLEVPVEERDKDGHRRWTGGKRLKRGTPQGGVISPLLANLYLNRLLKHFRQCGKQQQWQAQIVAYADDFVILSRGHAEEAKEWAQAVLVRMGLVLNEQKTSVRNSRQETFDFLGYTFGLRYWRTGRTYLTAWPSKKSMGRLREKVSQLLEPWEQAPWSEVRDRLNQLLGGWAQYFSYGSLGKAYALVNHHVEERVRHFLRRRHKVRQGATRRFPKEVIFGTLGVKLLRRPPLA